MPEFTYEALANTGLRTNGTLTANNEREAMAQLDSRGLFPVRITQARSAAVKSFRFGGHVRARYLSAFYSQLADLLHSGVPLLRSLDIIERLCSQPVLAEAVREVRAKVADGMGLAEAMAQHPRVFDELTVSMVHAGQEGAFLEDVLERIADFTEHQEDLKSRAVGAMAYPIFLAVLGFLVLNVLVIFFVPKFEAMFERLDERGQLPFLTKMLIGSSHFLQGWWWALILGGVSSWYLWRRWSQSEAGRPTVDRWRLMIPKVGGIYLSFALARFTRILGTLLHNGIPILNALRIAKDSMGNRVLTKAIEQSVENITAGDSLAAPLTACKYFPRDVVEMIAVGEESNKLDKVLVDISESLEKRTSRQLDLFVRLLEPMMLLVMASAILVVVAGLLIPIFKMSSTVR